MWCMIRLCSGNTKRCATASRPNSCRGTEHEHTSRTFLPFALPSKALTGLLPSSNYNPHPRRGITQVQTSMDMSQALGGLRCKVNPGPRTHAASVYFKQKLVLLGGRASEDELKNDAWYRDDRTPTAFVANGPSSYTSGRSPARINSVASQTR